MFADIARFTTLACVAGALGLTGCTHPVGSSTGQVRPVPGTGKPATAATPAPPPARINSVVQGNLWSSAMEERRANLEKVATGTGIDVSRTLDNQLRMVIPNDLAFAPHSVTVGAALRPLLDTLAAGLGTNAEIQVAITAHTDSTGSDPQNNTLSLERARNVREYLLGKGVLTPFIQVSGRGARDPVASNDSAAGRTRNRRMEITLRETAK